MHADRFIDQGLRHLDRNTCQYQGRTNIVIDSCLLDKNNVADHDVASKFGVETN